MNFKKYPLVFLLCITVNCKNDSQPSAAHQNHVVGNDHQKAKSSFTDSESKNSSKQTENETKKIDVFHVVSDETNVYSDKTLKNIICKLKAGSQFIVKNTIQPDILEIRLDKIAKDLFDCETTLTYAFVQKASEVSSNSPSDEITLTKETPIILEGEDVSHCSLAAGTIVQVRERVHYDNIQITLMENNCDLPLDSHAKIFDGDLLNEEERAGLPARFAVKTLIKDIYVYDSQEFTKEHEMCSLVKNLAYLVSMETGKIQIPDSIRCKDANHFGYVNDVRGLWK